MQYSYRAQLIAYYCQILLILEKFPSVKISHFLAGEMNEKKSPADDLDSSTQPDPRSATLLVYIRMMHFLWTSSTLHCSIEYMIYICRALKQRPRRVLSSDGRLFQNLWFIPHFTEILGLFKNLKDEVCLLALETMTSIGIVPFRIILLHLLLIQYRI